MHRRTRYKLCIVLAIVIAFATSMSYITGAEVDVIDKEAEVDVIGKGVEFEAEVYVEVDVGAEVDVDVIDKEAGVNVGAEADVTDKRAEVDDTDKEADVDAIDKGAEVNVGAGVDVGAEADVTDKRAEVDDTDKEADVDAIDKGAEVDVGAEADVTDKRDEVIDTDKGAEVDVIDKVAEVDVIDKGAEVKVIDKGATEKDLVRLNIPAATPSPQVGMERRSTGVHVRPNESDFAYVMSIDYSDQMTGSGYNLASMRCWVSSLGPDARVVEPFARWSILGVDPAHLLSVNDMQTATKEELESVKMSDMFDMSKDSRSQDPALVSWDHFIQAAPRKMAIVREECSNGRCIDCGDAQSKELIRQMGVFETRYGFEVMRICYNSRTKSDVMKLLYSNHSPKEVVIVFKTFWGGASNLRHSIRGCSRDIIYPMSAKIKQDARHYIQKYMSSVSYVSVMVRLEHFSLRNSQFKSKSDEQILSILQSFYNDIVKKVNEFKAQHGISAVFLTMDCRKQGSVMFRDFKDNKVFQLMTKSIGDLYRMLYGSSSTLEDWDESFYSVSSFRNNGYIAMLQKHLAASGVCLITAGGGSYQETTRRLHYQYNGNTNCISTI